MGQSRYNNNNVNYWRTDNNNNGRNRIHTMRLYTKNHQDGFTLIEFIVALVIASIMAAMAYSFFGSALTQSGIPILRFQKESNLHTVMENIVLDYNRMDAINLRYKWQSSHN